jgi:hypothetical protein
MQDTNKDMLTKLASKVEGVVTWGIGIDQKVDEVATSTMKMKASLNMMLLVQKSLVKKFSLLLLVEGNLFSNESMHNSEMQKGNNR